MGVQVTHGIPFLSRSEVDQESQKVCVDLSAAMTEEDRERAANLQVLV
jgi:hypothetical protein